MQDIYKDLEKLSMYQWLGCAGHHTNLIAQAGFKNVVTAARLVKKCKKIVEHIKHSTNSTNLLIEYEKILELPLLKVLQENNTRWWSILIMLERLIKIVDAVNGVLAMQGKNHLLINQRELNAMEVLVKLLTPFKEATKNLSGENYVTISFVIPFFNKLKKHLAEDPKDIQIIKDMKTHMLKKLENRYTKK